MTPERESALEACAEALKVLLHLYKPKAWGALDTGYSIAEAWANAIAAAERLKGLK